MREVGRRFGLILIETSSTPPALQTPTGPVERITASPVRWRSVAEAQGRISFPIRLPTWLPNGVTFQGVYVSAPDSVLVHYARPGAGSAGLGIVERKYTPEGYAIPASRSRTIVINHQDATYARGCWNEHQEWVDTADCGIMSWEIDGITYVITDSGLHLTAKDVVRIAESLR